MWSGASLTTGSTHGIHVCDYQGTPHLCFWEGEQTKTWGRGRSVILDPSYQIVATVSGGNTALDFHEFRLIQNGTVALVTVYKPSPYDLSEINQDLSSQLGWIYNSGFKEIDIATGTVLFEWLALDHIEISETLVPLGTKGEGQILFDPYPWDYFHINSVEKTRDGDYIVSGRHTSAIYKISRRDGSIIWRLGGRHSDFTMDFAMGYQHDVRLVEETEWRTALSFFNNQWDGRYAPPPPPPPSRQHFIWDADIAKSYQSQSFHDSRISANDRHTLRKSRQPTEFPRQREYGDELGEPPVDY